MKLGTTAASAALRGAVVGRAVAPQTTSRCLLCHLPVATATTTLTTTMPMPTTTTTTTTKTPPIAWRTQRAALHTSRRRDSAWSAALQVATSAMGSVAKRAVKETMGSESLRVIAKEMKFLTGNMLKLLGSGHPSLDRAAKYYAQGEGKHVRPLIVLLMSQATHLCPKNPRHPPSARGGVDVPISPLQILSDTNPLSGFDQQQQQADLGAAAAEDILPTQRRLAEIIELIHTASLLHDDVIDHSEMRRSAASANLEFGNKMAVLAGDFLLGRASVALARLRNFEVVELMATVIANLVEGEFMQLKNTQHDEKNPKWSEDALGYYLQKTYLKTASLISKSCRGAAILGNADSATVEAAYSYGRNLGLAFQLVDDMLDFTQSGKTMGKPVGADLKLGLATAPLLFAWKQMPELGALVGRKFSHEGDATKAYNMVLQSDGIEQTRALAHEYAEKAIADISGFPDSEAKTGLIEMALNTIKRQK